eukprot:m.31924 g.31924  ORF g.31924 m.31924 type:complete len:282 (-) comp16552_c0_seq1:187-1032(-)
MSTNEDEKKKIDKERIAAKQKDKADLKAFQQCAQEAWPSKFDGFLKWFKATHKDQTTTNGNMLIKYLNKAGVFPVKGANPERLRRELNCPTIYCIQLDCADGDVVKTKCSGPWPAEWVLCKVGFTHGGPITSNGDDSKKTRMDTVASQIERSGGQRKSTQIFALIIGAIDTTPFAETEKRIREKVGLPINGKVAKSLDLPNHTEWVLTHNNRLDLVRFGAALDLDLDIFKPLKKAEGSLKFPKKLKFLFTDPDEVQTAALGKLTISEPQTKKGTKKAKGAE